MTHGFLKCLACAALLLGWAGSLEAKDVTYPKRPGERDFILDEAKMISPADAQAIKPICDKLLTDRKTPISVVTIASLSAYGAKGWDISRYAMNLFGEWGIGFKEKGQNRGILLLISKGDRKARIELGADWGRTKDAHTQKIMNDLITADFKRGKFSAGILAGVKGLDAMAREQKIPARPRPAWHTWVTLAVIGLGIFTIVSLIRRGGSGWAWLLWGAVFAIIGTILYQMMASRSRSMGWGGGSFGGGFSGGGGATGSW